MRRGVSQAEEIRSTDVRFATGQFTIATNTAIPAITQPTASDDRARTKGRTDDETGLIMLKSFQEIASKSGKMQVLPSVVQASDTIERNIAIGTMHNSRSALVRDQLPETFMSELLASTETEPRQRQASLPQVE